MATKTATPALVYAAVLDYCTEQGFIKQLASHLKQAESKRFEKQKISKDGLQILDAVHCVYDKPRTIHFLKELDRCLTSRSIVIEAGLGTGILSFFAGTRAKQVYGFELNPTILKLAKDVLGSLLAKGIAVGKPLLALRDATRVRPSIKADIIISENLYTGMFFEKQVQITNHLRKYLKPGGKMIPSAMDSFLAPAFSHFPGKPKHTELSVVLENPSLKPKALSPLKKYDVLEFTKHNGKGVRTTLEFKSLAEGIINSILITSEVRMPSGRVIKHDETTFLNNDIVLAVVPAVSIAKGDAVRIQLSYGYGESPSSASLTVTKIEP